MFIDELATVRPAGADILRRVIFAVAISFARNSVRLRKGQQPPFGGVRENRRRRFIPVVLPKADEKVNFGNGPSASLMYKDSVFRSLGMLRHDSNVPFCPR